MKDAEVIEAMARAILRVDQENARPFECARAAFAICAPAIREMCAEVADEAFWAVKAPGDMIRALPLPTPHDGLTDTSHHAGSSAGQVIDPRFFVVDEGRQQLRAKRDATRAGSSAGESEDWRKELPGIARIAPAPSGGEMVMVPREPTPEMLIKAGRVLNLGGSFHEALRVAIAASPAPPHQGGKSE